MTEIMTYADDTDQPQEISQHIVISRDKSVYVPEIIRKSIVYRDHNVECLTFDCPRYWSGIDISELNIYVNYIAEGQKKKEEDPGSFLCENVVVDEDNTDIFHFDWRITSNVSEFQDKLIFIVCAKSVDAEGNEELHWNSRLCTDLEVQEGLEASAAIVEKYPDVIEQILSKLGKQIEFRNSGKAIQYRNAGENIWVDLVQLEDIKGDAAVIIESNFKGSDTTANILTKTGETGDKWYSTDEGVYYMINSFGDWINCGSGENLKKIEDEIDALKGDIEQLKQNGTGTGGLSTEAIDKLEEVGNYLAYTTADGGSKWTELISILRGSSSGGSGEGSGETEVTLSSISATYTGGDVATGTALSDLTGITVTALYSDGSTENVTEYTLSGEILEGENTITVSYGELTTTFTVIGVAESGGGTTDALPTDGLLAYFDLRNSSSSAVGTASGIPTATLGTGALFSWASQAITSADDYGAVLPRAMMFSASCNETQTDLGTEFTFIILVRNGVPSDSNGSNGVIFSTISPHWLFKGFYNTSSGTSSTDVSIGSNEDSNDDYNFLVKRVNGELMKVIFDTSSIEYVGSDYEDFVSWQSKPIIGTVYNNGSTVGCAIYNRSLTDVEIEEARAFFKTLEVA